MSPESFATLLRRAGEFAWHNQESALNSAVDDFHDGIRDNFSKEEDSSGTKWPPHALSTVLRYGVHPLLILRTPMSVAAMGGTHSVKKLRRRDRTLTANLGIDSNAIPYMRTHQHGDDDRNIPRREYFYLSNANRPKLIYKFRRDVIQSGNMPQFMSRVLRQ